MLVLCTDCRRHVRSTESECPFCGAEREAERTEETSFLVTSRAAFLAGGIAIAAAAAGCNNSSSSASSGTSGIAQPYGAPPDPRPMIDAGAPPPPSVTPTTSATTPPTPTTAVAPAYGGPPPRKP
jgi:hypothetical protein